MVWDEENRLRGINDNGRLHLYTYDHTGERALKSSAESSLAVINGLASAVITHTEDYTAYVSPYFVVQKGKFTKHYFEGSSRIVSKLGEGTFSHKNTGIMAGGLDYLKRTQKEQEARDRYIKGLNTPPGPPTQHGIYASPEWTGQPYPSIDWESISQNQEPPEGWPRYPKFNELGDVPGPPVQFGPPVTNANVKAGYGFIPNGVEEKNLYYYHPDHLGSSSYITDKEGQIIQHTEYMAFGEVLVDEHSTSNKMPYLFNGKELDYETGLYYYGARYYDPKTSIFLNVDPLVEKTGTPYAYTYNNPIRFIDPTGMEAEECPSCPPALLEDQKAIGSDGQEYFATRKENDVYNTLPSQPLDWVQQKDIEEVVFTGKARVFSSESRDNQLEPNYEFPLHNGKAEMMSGFGESIGMLLASLELETKMGSVIIGAAAIFMSKGKATDDVLKVAYTQKSTLKKSFEDQVNDLIKLNGGKNSVKINTSKGAYHYDLRGAPHKGVETPHVQRSFW